MKKFTFLFVSFIVLFSCVVFLTFSIADRLAEYSAKKQEMVTELNFEDRLMNVWEWIPFNTIGEEKDATWIRLDNEADRLYRETLYLGLILALIVVTFIVANRLFYRKKEYKLQIYGLVMVFAAFSFLYLGLQSPFMELEVFNEDLAFKIPLNYDPSDIPFSEELSDVPLLGDLTRDKMHFEIDQVFEGRMYYLYQNKSIFHLIGMLYTGGNFLVAILLIFFSVVFPLVKLFSSIIILMNPRSAGAKKAVPVVVYLGKWSMPDVFVVSVFLAYLSTTNLNTGVDSASDTLIGTYFFLAFVVFSISSGFILKKVVHSKNDSVLDYV